MDIERYYAEAKVSASTLTLHHTILHQAFRKAANDRLIATNIAADLDGKPRRTREKVSEDALKHAWSATETPAFLAAARLLDHSQGRSMPWRSTAAPKDSTTSEMRIGLLIGITLLGLGIWMSLFAIFSSNAESESVEISDLFWRYRKT